MNIINSLVEITIPTPDTFLKIKETLTRIGIASKRDKTLYQSCHILHKQGKYYIVHFKELFILDGQASELSEEDTGRRNAIVNLLEEWKLSSTVNPSLVEHPVAQLSNIKILPFKEKAEWNLVPKYSIGKKK